MRSGDSGDEPPPQLKRPPKPRRVKRTKRKTAGKSVPARSKASTDNYPVRDIVKDSDADDEQSDRPSDSENNDLLETGRAYMGPAEVPDSPVGIKSSEKLKVCYAVRSPKGFTWPNFLVAGNC